MRERGMAHPVVIILLFVLSAGAIIFFSYKKNFTESRVKGVSNSSDTAGFSVLIKSDDNWDFVEYLCSDLDKCTRKSTISGGATNTHELVVMYDYNWTNINYVKVFVKPSWGTQTRMFNLTVSNAFARPTTIEENGITYAALVLPIDEINSSFKDAVAVFSD